ncbi:IS66 family insertion sequence element accessory protein TnpB, partial [Corallococcus sp. ZKHCc1 1396]|nr:IS66 family insertion sequence element accessory protein TnpB [Corallococcus soli]
MAKQVEKPEWERVAEAFEASGQTQREFALARGVRLSTLQSWVYRRRRAGPAE